MKVRGYHVLATETDGGYKIIVPEYPNITETAADATEIIAVASAAVEKEKVIHKMKTAVCPLCGQTYTGYPALSRKDNKTEICPDCGTMQALEAAGVCDEQKNKILSEIHRLQEEHHENNTVS